MPSAQVLVLSLIRLTLINSAILKSVYLHKDFCTRLEHLPSDVTYRSVSSKIDCGKLYLESNSSQVGMVVFTGADGTIFCGLISQQPLTTTCLNDSSHVEVYTQSQLANCTVQCDFHYELLGISYCAHQTSVNRNYKENLDFCSSIGGMLAEAETIQHVHLMASISGPDSLIYLGGNDFETDRVFKWNRGHIVLDTLFHPTEPSNHGGIEHCLVFYSDSSGLYGLGDMSCDRRERALCALRCN